MEEDNREVVITKCDLLEGRQTNISRLIYALLILIHLPIGVQDRKGALPVPPQIFQPLNCELGTMMVPRTHSCKRLSLKNRYFRNF